MVFAKINWYVLNMHFILVIYYQQKFYCNGRLQQANVMLICQYTSVLRIVKLNKQDQLTDKHYINITPQCVTRPTSHFFLRGNNIWDIILNGM